MAKALWRNRPGFRVGFHENGQPWEPKNRRRWLEFLSRQEATSSKSMAVASRPRVVQPPTPQVVQPPHRSRSDAPQVVLPPPPKAAQKAAQADAAAGAAAPGAAAGSAADATAGAGAAAGGSSAK